MAPLRFSVPSAKDFDPRVWETAYITGIEGIPWLCEHSVEGNQFSIGRQIDESGKINIVWPTRAIGNVCLSSTSLRISEGAYSLPIEIARGTVHRLKTQAAEWQRVGMRLPEDFFPLAEAALNELLHALTTRERNERGNAHAQQAIDLALHASVVLCDAFSRQALESRCNNEGRLATLLGCQLDEAVKLESVGDALQKAFNLVCISAELGLVESSSGGCDYSTFDRQMEWATNNNQRICMGPLVDFRDGRLPNWMFLLNEGFENILRIACDHAQKTVERYRGQVHLWNCAAAINAPNKFRWTDEEILRMSVSLIETVRRGDDRSPVLLSIDQPWSEYLRKDANGISPLHFADALIRADLGLSGLALEINFDNWPGGTFPRDPIEINRLVDRWSMLGLPLMVILSTPTGTPNPDNPRRVSNWQMPSPGKPLEDGPDRAGDAAGRLTAESIVQLLLSKPSVHAVIWNSIYDRTTHQTSTGCGLWNGDGKAKPLLSSMTRLRKSCLH